MANLVAVNMPMTSPPSRSDIAESLLRSAILNGELAPGTRLLPNEIAVFLGLSISPTPLREAIHRLSEQGLVTLTNQRGARVSPLSAQELDEIYELRLLLEPRALEKSVSVGDAEWRARVKAKASELRAIKSTADHAEWEVVHRAFHNTLVEECQSDWLLRWVHQLSDNSSRYRAKASRTLGRQKLRGSHDELMRACLSGDGAMARVIYEEHIERVLPILRSVLSDANDAQLTA